MTLTFDITNNCYYWIIETDDALLTVISPEFISEENALEWYNLVSREILSKHGVTDED